MKRKTTIIIIFFSFSLIIFGCFLTVSPGNAQVGPQWAQPQTIPGLKDSGFYPMMIVDSEGAIHFFHSQPIGDTMSIFYTVWSYQDGWSHLIDIIASPQGDARILGANIGKNGWIHLIFWGGDGTGANIFYTKAPLVNVDSSTAWSEPVLIGESALDPPTGALAIDNEDSLIVVYSSGLQGNGLYTTQSSDSGQSWSPPEAFFNTYNRQMWPSALNVHTDENGQIYGTWAVADESGNGQVVYFAKRNLIVKSWSEPIIIAEAVDYEADTPSIIKYNDELILIFHNYQPTTRWMRTSLDEGETWSQPVQLFEQVGSNGAASLVIDNNQDLHILFGNRIDATATYGAWHSFWLGNQWSKPKAIASGPLILAGPNGEEGFSPSFVEAVISRGNLLFVIWRQDPVSGPTNIWYTYQLLDAPASVISPLPLVKLETPTFKIQPTETQLPILTPTPILAEIGQSISNTSPTSDVQSNNPNTNFLIGIGPFLLLLIVIVILQRRGK